MNLKIRIDGDERVVAKLSLARLRLSVDELPRYVGRAGHIIAREWRAQIRGSRTRAKREGREPGIFRKTTRRGRRTTFKRVASIPDHVLAIDTGRLRQSIGVATREGIFKRGKLGFSVHYVDVGTKVVYAAIHEFGGVFRAFGKYRTRMPKRPHRAPGI